MITKKLVSLGLQLGCLALAAAASAQTNNGTYYLFNRNSGMNLDAYGGNTTNGTPLIQYQFNGYNNQQWNLKSLGEARPVGIFGVVSACEHRREPLSSVDRCASRCMAGFSIPSPAARVSV